MKDELTMMVYFVEFHTDTGPDFFGPFDTHQEAVAWRKENSTESAMISVLESPEDYSADMERS
jgi:hypothetical protein